jgi:phosphatidylserine decarboxylase
MLYFYRYYPDTNIYSDEALICPCDGTITEMKKVKNYQYISVFLSPFNIHTQVYPVNGTVVKRHYDHSGKFDIVTDAYKSRDNEKKIHYIMNKKNALIKLTQIAGFLPRRISSSDKINEKVQAGSYLGMIKFGSRVDLLFPLTTPTHKFSLKSKWKVGERIHCSELIGDYLPTSYMS